MKCNVSIRNHELFQKQTVLLNMIMCFATTTGHNSKYNKTATLLKQLFFHFYDTAITL